MRRFVYFAFLLLVPYFAKADTMLINFETVPPGLSGQSFFADAGPAQTIVVAGVATFSGGVILGDESNLPAQSFATPPNVYGTADFGDNLSSTLSIAFNPAFTVTQVSFPVLNGQTVGESYVVDAYNGATLVASQTLSMASNGASGYGIFDVTAADITSVTIAPTVVDGSWDYSIDSIALNETVQQAFGSPAATPEPESIELLGLGAVAFLGFYRLRRP